MEIKEESIKKYLEQKYKKKISDVSIEKLGSGVLGTGYRVTFYNSGHKKTLVLKSLMKEHLNLDHHSDRAASLLDAHDNYNTMELHVKSHDVVAEKNDGSLLSLDKVQEFYILMDEAYGTDLFKDFDEIRKTRVVTPEVTQKVIVLSDFLATLHKNKRYSVSLYRRKLRDTLGSGGSLLGILDMHPDDAFHIFEKEWMAIIKKSMHFWHRARGMHHRLCEIHADFHPGNLWFDHGKLTVLDRARGRFGEPADDISAFTINPIMYALTTEKNFSGPFKDIFDTFWNNYFQKTQDKEMRKIIAPYYAFRIAVVTNPLFYNDDFFGGKEQAYLARKKLIYFALRTLDEKEFNPSKINFYIQ